MYCGSLQRLPIARFFLCRLVTVAFAAVVLIQAVRRARALNLEQRLLCFVWQVKSTAGLRDLHQQRAGLNADQGKKSMYKTPGGLTPCLHRAVKWSHRFAGQSSSGPTDHQQSSVAALRRDIPL